MALRYAILGSLSTAPASGYDLSRQFDKALGWYWAASFGQIYPELKRLEEAGLIKGSSTKVGAKLEKRVYSLTGVGLAELTSWVSGQPHYRPNRDPERLQLIFLDLVGTESVREHLCAHRDRFEAVRERRQAETDEILEGRHERVNKRLEGYPARQRRLSLLLSELAGYGDIARATLEIQWAEDALGRLDEIEVDLPAGAGNSAASNIASG